jgi:acyl-CoA synthetase (AMP-forming)/AMP-acid ligase II
MDDANFGMYLHSRSARSTLTDAAGGAVCAPVGIPTAAGALLGAGLAPGEFVVVACNLTIAPARVYMGALYAGIVPILVHELDIEHLLPSIRERTGVKFLWVSGERQQQTYRALYPEMRILCGMDALIGSPPHTPRGDQELAALMPTSGSTGAPRLVRVTHGNLRANTEAIIRSQNLQPGDTAMLILPLSYCFGASVLHSHLAIGGGVVLDRRFMFPNRVLDAIDEHGCVTFAGVPTVYRTLLKCLRQRGRPPHTLRRLLQAGGPLDADSITAVRRAIPDSQFYVMYGATEATARISTLDPDHLDQHLGSVGAPLDNVDVKVVGSDGETLPAGQSGEIHVRGRSVTNGYFLDPEATSEKYRDGWLITGDLGHLDEDGFLYIDGRRSDFIKMRGMRLSLREVETIVRTIDGVDDVAVCGVRDDDRGETIGLYVVAARGYDERDLRRRIHGTLPGHWHISHLTTMPSLPRTSSGKLDRPHLTGMLLPIPSGQLSNT